MFFLNIKYSIYEQKVWRHLTVIMIQTKKVNPITKHTLSEERFEMMNHQTESRRRHYYEGDCSEPAARRGIAQAYISMLKEHGMAYMCTADRFSDECTADNVKILCG